MAHLATTCDFAPLRGFFFHAWLGFSFHFSSGVGVLLCFPEWLQLDGGDQAKINSVVGLSQRAVQ